MELESTSSFKDIDIDKMLEHTTMDDFMRGLYTNQTETETKADKNLNVMSAIMTGRGLDEVNKNQTAAQLNFGQEDQEEIQSDQLRMKALQSLRDRRLRLK